LRPDRGSGALAAVPEVVLLGVPLNVPQERQRLVPGVFEPPPDSFMDPRVGLELLLVGKPDRQRHQELTQRINAVRLDRRIAGRDAMQGVPEVDVGDLVSHDKPESRLLLIAGQGEQAAADVDVTPRKREGVRGVASGTVKV
jgi:hypothetical protein